LLQQPSKPDITLLETAMKAACIEVKEVSQDPENWAWIIDEDGNLNNGGWREETPFVHNLIADDDTSLTNYSQSSRDVTVNDATFWCIHVVSAYESVVTKDGDGESSLGYGIVPMNGSPIVFLYDEAIREASNVSVNKNITKLRQINLFHEVVHLFGLRHEDGGVMATGNSNKLPGTNTYETHNFETTNTRSEYLLIEQIKKVQAKLFPAW
jgi:hypothetical protein